MASMGGGGASGVTASGKKSESIGAEAKARRRVLVSSVSARARQEHADDVREGSQKKVRRTESVEERDEPSGLVLGVEREHRDVVEDDGVLRTGKSPASASFSSRVRARGRDEAEEGAHKLAAERDVVGGPERLLAELLEREPSDAARRPRHRHLAPIHAQDLLLALGVADDPPQRILPRRVVLALDKPPSRTRAPALPRLGRAKVARRDGVRLGRERDLGARDEAVVGRRREVDDGRADGEGAEEGGEGGALDTLLVEVCEVRTVSGDEKLWAAAGRQEE